MAELADLDWQGHRLQLLAQRAAWDPEQRTLLVADLHLGKAETFQAHGIALPSDGDLETLNALLELAAQWPCQQVIVLGDLVHSRLGLTPQLRQKLEVLPELLGCPLRLIGGNHDRGSWIAGLQQEPPQTLGPWWLSHEPDPHPGLLNLCGHLHPVALVGRGNDRLRLPCFSLDGQQQRLALPAFGRLTGGHPAAQGERLWLVAGGELVDWNHPRQAKAKVA
ncbi:MAG: ligase-associated DNA damage response endonuclease PdeM [Prochlorococcaceae cyanobacterium]